jgi:hypothetical protein
MAALFLLGAGFLAWETQSNQAQSISYITVVVTQDP